MAVLDRWDSAYTMNDKPGYILGLILNLRSDTDSTLTVACTLQPSLFME
jgi:hypothetical protein